VPPAHSAKKVDGERAYVLARRGDVVELAPVEVTAHQVSLAHWDTTTWTAVVDLDVSAGYYVRSLARDLGTRLGVPAHLTALRRTGSGAWTLDDAHALGEVVEAVPDAFAAMCQGMASVLQDWPSLTLNEAQVQAVLAGRLFQLDGSQIDTLGAEAGHRVRLLDALGGLVGVARSGAHPSALHADIVLR
jgi:tRNA pseudouridine55 synthase